MIPKEFFSDPLNAELATLIIASSMPDDEKRTWLETLPVMNHDEKNELLANLREEVKELFEMEAKAITQLDAKINELFGK